MKKTFRMMVYAAGIIAMLCIWPFCLVRQDFEMSSVTNSGNYEDTDYIRHDRWYRQSFTAQTSKLNYIEVIFNAEEDVTETDGSFHFELTNEKGEIVFKTDIPFADRGLFFWHIDINKWLKKGKKYQFSVSVDQEYDDIWRGIITLNEQDYAPGSEELYLGENKMEHPGMTVYGYGIPLI